MKDRAVIHRYSGGTTRRQTVYLQHPADVDGKGFWATANEANSDLGYTLHADGSVDAERYRNGERIMQTRLRAHWEALTEEEPVDGPYVVREERDSWHVYWRGTWGIGHDFGKESIAREAAATLNALVALDQK